MKMTIDELVARARADGASDIHLINGLPPKYRKDGKLENMSEEPVTAEEYTSMSGMITFGFSAAFSTGESSM